MIKKAIISVWDKTGIVELAQFLIEQNIEIISTGGTQKTLEEAGFQVTPISAITGLEAIMNGRVKTLDPKIFGGILADRENRDHLSDLTDVGAVEIDLVVVNFYPFVKEAVEKKLSFREAIEFIDIGGPSMLRAAAKNYSSVIPLCDPDQYQNFIAVYKENYGNFSSKFREIYAAKVFALTAAYESAIQNYFQKDESVLPKNININLKRSADLRYGENPHQKAAFYLPADKKLPWIQHQGQALSYNNYADLESAINLVSDFKQSACCIIKHANPCGFSFGVTAIEAYIRAITTDPISYFGGIVGFNSEVDAETAIELNKSFLECIIAPSFSDAALEIFKKKKNLRIVTIDPKFEKNRFSFKFAAGGFLYQESDSYQNEFENMEIRSKRQPSENELSALKLSWKLVRFVKSNAIVFTNEKQLLGVGAGQMSRVDSVKIAIRKASDAGLNLKNAVMASDAFFPFPDGVEIAAQAGITAVIQPGGSIKDQDVIKHADELDLIMVMTNIRHFLH